MSTLTGTPPTTSPTPSTVVPNPRPFRLVRHSLALAKRSLIKTWRTPEALIDVTLQPALFLVIFVYIFGGAVAGSTHDYLQFLLPGILAQTIAMGAIAIGVNLNTDIAKGIFDRFRSLPIPRSAPLLGAVLGDVVRYVIVTISTLGDRLPAWASGSTPARCSALAGCLLAVLFALCLSWLPVFVGMKVRTPARCRASCSLLIMPLTFASNVFVARRHPARLDAGVREGQPADPPGRRRCAGCSSARRSATTCGGRSPGAPASWWCSCRWRCAPTARRSDPGEQVVHQLADAVGGLGRRSLRATRPATAPAAPRHRGRRRAVRRRRAGRRSPSWLPSRGAEREQLPGGRRHRRGTRRARRRPTPTPRAPAGPGRTAPRRRPGPAAAAARASTARPAAGHTSATAGAAPPPRPAAPPGAAAVGRPSRPTPGPPRRRGRAPRRTGRVARRAGPGPSDACAASISSPCPGAAVSPQPPLGRRVAGQGELHVQQHPDRPGVLGGADQLHVPLAARAATRGAGCPRGRSGRARRPARPCPSPSGRRPPRTGGRPCSASATARAGTPPFSWIAARGRTGRSPARTGRGGRSGRRRSAAPRPGRTCRAPAAPRRARPVPGRDLAAALGAAASAAPAGRARRAGRAADDRR